MLYKPLIFNLLGEYLPNYCHLVQHETKKEKEEPKVRIYPKELLESYPIPKKFVAEKDSYNGLTYIGKFGWD